jgi:hypothetical protein
MPLVRYALGDIARMRVAPCSCDVGSTWPSLVLEGRERDAFRIGREWITTKAVDDALAGVPLALYQLSETAPRQYRLEGIPEVAGSPWRGDAASALEALLSPERLVVEEVRDLPMDENQKFRFTRPEPRGEVPS